MFKIMSKVGEKPVILKEGVSLSQEGRELTVRGPLGEVKLALPERLRIETVGNEILVKREAEDKKTRSSHGTMARLLANAIQGTTVGFEKSLEIVGTGYRAQMEGDTLVLSLGFSHPIKYKTPLGTKIEAQENKIKVTGVDRELVGRTADKIKRFRKPDPYKGKGIRYLGEKLRLKPGKAAAKAGPVTGGK